MKVFCYQLCQGRWFVAMGLLALFIWAGSLSAAETGNRGKVFVDEDMPAVKHVAMMPLKAPTDAARALCTFLVLKELQKTDRYTLMEPGNMVVELQLPELALAALTAEQAADVGSLLGVDAVIVGSVSRFESADQDQDHPAQAEVALRLLHCETGKPLWTVTLRETATSTSIKLSEHAEHAVAKMVRALEKKLPVIEREEEPVVEVVEEEPQHVEEVSLEIEEQDDVVLSTPMHADAPTGLAASEIGLREVSLVWDKPSGRPHRYRLERSLSARDGYEVISEVSPKRRFYRDYDQTNLAMADDTTYFYRLVAVQKDGMESHPTKPVEVRTAPAPEPPAEVEVRAPDARLVMLDWEPSLSESVKEYVVERALGSSPNDYEEIAWVRDDHYRDDGQGDHDRLEDDTEYLYRISSINSVGSRGVPSTPVAIHTPPIPNPVKNLDVVDGGVRCVPLSWTIAAETNVVAYRIYRTGSENGNFELLKEVGGRTKTRFIDGGGIPGNLPDKTTFYYRMEAVNSVGAVSDASSVIRATTRGIPPVIRHLEATSGQPRQVTLKWEESPDDKVRGYEIWRAVGNNRNFVMVGKTNRRESNVYTDRGGTKRASGNGLLLDGNDYRYKVLAFNTAGVQSDWSGVVSATTKLAPENPTKLRATTDQAHEILITWGSNKELDLHEYLVEVGRSPDGPFREMERVEARTDSLVATTTDGELGDGIKRYYRIRAIDQDGLESGWSGVVQGQAKPAPDTPKNLYAHPGERSMVLTWDAPPQSDISEYRIWKKEMLSWELLDTTDDNEYRIPVEKLSRKHTLSISSVDQDGLESQRSISVKTDAVVEH